VTAQASTALAERAGIRRLSVSTPFVVGPVNCYLIEDRPLTLVDTGPNSGTSLDELQRALDAHGRAIEELELIVLTHQHVDHLGLLEVLERRSGADVAALHLLAAYLAEFAESAAADDRYVQAIMRRHGVAPDLITALGAVGATLRSFGSAGHVTRPLHDGDTLQLRDRRLQVLHRPGHSPTDTLFWDPDRRILLAGDHLIGHISSNPLVSRPLTGNGPRPRSLISYIASLRATRELPADLVLSGHGEPIVGHRALIDQRLRMHERRARKILRMLRAGPLTGFEIALGIWGDVAVTQAYLTLSEVLGHLDLLIAEGRARECDDGGVARFEAVGDRS
jgi:glyoxylase-like metal-dependent hydrolase (beta-lactamase superfamily II)